MRNRAGTLWRTCDGDVSPQCVWFSSHLASNSDVLLTVRRHDFNHCPEVRRAVLFYLVWPKQNETRMLASWYYADDACFKVIGIWIEDRRGIKRSSTTCARTLTRARGPSPFFINRKCEEKGVHLRRGTEGYCLSRNPELDLLLWGLYKPGAKSFQIHVHWAKRW